MFERGGLLALAVLALYVWVAPTHIVDGDNAEFSALGALGGVAHPTGYPSYVLYLRLWSWLPLGTPAHVAAIATAVLGAAQMLVLHAACRAWGARNGAATATVAILAGAPVVLAIYTEAEVFAINGLVASLVLWLAAVKGPVRGAMRCGLLGLVAGLGLASHVTCVLVAPVGVLGAIRGVREAPRRVVATAIAFAGLALGLSTYLYMLIAPVNAMAWGDIHGLGDIVTMILRREYGGPGAFAVQGSGGAVTGDNLLAFAHTIGRAWLYAPAVLGTAALGLRIARPGQTETRAAWLCLLAALLLAGPLLIVRFNIPPFGLGLYVVHRFHLLPTVLLAVPVAAGFELIAHALDGMLAIARSRVVVALVTVVGFAAVSSLSLPHLLRVHAPAIQQQALNLLKTLPPDAVILGASDDLYGGITYAQVVLGMRPDVTYIQWPLMTLTWYRERARARGVALDKGEGFASVRVAEAVLASKRPLFVDYRETNLLETYPSFPEGILLHVLPKGSQRPPAEDILALNKAIFDKFELGYELPGKDDEWPTEVHFKYAYAWRMIAGLLEKEGHHDDAEWAIAAARAIGPQ